MHPPGPVSGYIPPSPQTPLLLNLAPDDTTTEDQFSLFEDQGLCIEMSYKPRKTPLSTAAQQNQGWDTVTVSTLDET
ncbi:uncharacterized protein N7518_001968 [Penicillium psychrosexuale]|uniref:uncharacterized protein n=1 Tax=Penicillium psychrosexuale TaxID=1002107 RepID=UPI0025458CC1|nr:uncharacterized protein N7518_001968 [Penicillium psychrosexuale]KAJ5799900.1 hypothetical protein N7518_001968 [Penicillium psychrosexuale]